MRSVLLAVVLLLAPSAASSDADAASDEDTAPEHETVVVLIPAGDFEKGERAFRDLGCSFCHAVSTEDVSTAPESGPVGPVIGYGQRDQGAGRIASSILAPSHEIHPDFREIVEVQGPMPDYSNTLTVRELANLIAFIQGLVPESEPIRLDQ